MSIQFFHSRRWHKHWSEKGGSTYAINIGESLENSKVNNIEIGSSVVIEIGVSKCCEKDNFNKKIGRDLSSSRLKSETFLVCEITKLLKEEGKIKTKMVLKSESGISVLLIQSSQVSKFRVHLVSHSS